MTNKALFCTIALILGTSSRNTAFSAQDISGVWQGKLQPKDRPPLRLVLKIAREGDDGWSATLYSIDQGPGPIPVSSTTLRGSTLSLAVAAVHGSYRGDVSTNGTSISGIWTQGPPVALVFRRVGKEAAWPIDVTPMSEDTLIRSLQNELDYRTAGDWFSGAVLLARNGKPIFAKAYGFANREAKTPNTLDTRFRIGSMNKMFTAVATLQLVEAGKLRLNDPLGRYLPDYPNKELASKVTIHDLLTHTGGTGDIFGPQFDAHREELRTLQDYTNLYGSRGLEFQPGSKWKYSNYGFILLGVVIEKVSGQSYYDYVREHIYKPAGMSSTDSEPEDQAVPARSTGYTKMYGDQWEPNTETLPYRGTSAGGGYSTVGDLLKFADALWSNELLSASYTEMLTKERLRRQTATAMRMVLRIRHLTARVASVTAAVRPG
jgi:CubicO group peptidase (beta-lactamase class C family)